MRTDTRYQDYFSSENELKIETLNVIDRKATLAQPGWKHIGRVMVETGDGWSGCWVPPFDGRGNPRCLRTPPSQMHLTNTRSGTPTVRVKAKILGTREWPGWCPIWMACSRKNGLQPFVLRRICYTVQATLDLNQSGGSRAASYPVEVLPAAERKALFGPANRVDGMGQNNALVALASYLNRWRVCGVDSSRYSAGSIDHGGECPAMSKYPAGSETASRWLHVQRPRFSCRRRRNRP